MHDIVAPVAHKLFSGIKEHNMNSNLVTTDNYSDVSMQEREFNDYLNLGETASNEIVQNTSSVDGIVKKLSNLVDEYQNINDKLANSIDAAKKLDINNVLRLQVDLVTFSFSQDLLAKFASKGTQIIDTLMRNN